MNIIIISIIANANAIIIVITVNVIIIVIGNVEPCESNELSPVLNMKPGSGLISNINTDTGSIFSETRIRQLNR